MHLHCSYLPVGDLEQSQSAPSVGTPRVAPLGSLTPQAVSISVEPNGRDYSFSGAADIRHVPYFFSRIPSDSTVDGDV